jgi:hypothetical protein
VAFVLQLLQARLVNLSQSIDKMPLGMMQRAKTVLDFSESYYYGNNININTAL